LYRFKNKKSEK